VISATDLQSWGELFLGALTKSADLPHWHEQVGMTPALSSSAA
jgi:hypothetical protein